MDPNPITILEVFMWQVEIEEYNRMAQDSFPAEREYFRDFYEALRSLKM